MRTRATVSWTRGPLGYGATQLQGYLSPNHLDVRYPGKDNPDAGLLGPGPPESTPTRSWTTRRTGHLLRMGRDLLSALISSLISEARARSRAAAQPDPGLLGCEAESPSLRERPRARSARSPGPPRPAAARAAVHSVSAAPSGGTCEDLP